MTVWVVFHPRREDAVAVFSAYQKARKAYPQDGVTIMQYMVDPDRIFDLDEP